MTIACGSLTIAAYTWSNTLVLICGVLTNFLCIKCKINIFFFFLYTNIDLNSDVIVSRYGGCVLIIANTIQALLMAIELGAYTSRSGAAFRQFPYKSVSVWYK